MTIRKELDTSRVEPKSSGLVELTEAELDMVAGGLVGDLLIDNSGDIRINNVRLANNIRIGEVDLLST